MHILKADIFTLEKPDISIWGLQLTDSHGKNYELKKAISGSGMRLEGNHGIYIHTKGEKGTVVLEKNKLIDLQEVK